MKRFVNISLLCGVLACCIAGFFSGCESTDTADSLSITPSDATIIGTSNVVEFSVGGSTNTTSGSGLRTLSLPLEWRVSNALLGHISVSSGTVATYVRYAPNGINTIYVKDQYGAEGHATVTQQ
jgi:hypothetical protein